MKLETEGKELYLEGMRLRGIEDYEIIKSSSLPGEKAELKIKLIVEFPDNKQQGEFLEVIVKGEGEHKCEKT